MPQYISLLGYYDYLDDAVFERDVCLGFKSFQSHNYTEPWMHLNDGYWSHKSKGSIEPMRTESIVMLSVLV